MNYLSRQILFREIPEEVSLSYLITGCPVRCSDCHSKDSWNLRAGQLLSPDRLRADLAKYSKWITCVLFMGGEWQAEQFLLLLQIVRESGIKTALYTGLEDVGPELKVKLNYLKTGPYRAELGGLDSASTNQKLIEVSSGRSLNYYFSPQQQGTMEGEL